VYIAAIEAAGDAAALTTGTVGFGAKYLAGSAANLVLQPALQK
jgi:hypothetical protein